MTEPPSGSGQGRGIAASALALIERAGNALPHPATLFAVMALLVVALSGIVARFEVSVAHPGTGQLIHPVNLFSLAGLHRMLTSLVSNFTSFAPLGTVLVAMLGIAVAEASGVMSTALRLLVLTAPARLLTCMIVFAGVISNAAGEVGYLLLIPLAAQIFLAAGRHPLVGMAGAFAGVSGGYSANILLGTLDPLLAGLSEEAAHIVAPGYQVNAAANYYFMAVSTFVITAAGTWVTERVVAPRLGRYAGAASVESIQPLSALEKRGLWSALGALALMMALLLWGTVPGKGFLRDPATGSLLRSPFMSGIVALIFVMFAALGLAYGLAAGTFRRERDVIDGMGKVMGTLGLYLVLVFFAAQFVAYFNWSNLGLIIAVWGADLLRASGLGAGPLMIGFVLVTAFINLFMGSSSAKWALMAPIFVPMFMLLGYSPEYAQAAFRIGDSCTNVISPMMSYFALIIAFMERYEPKAGMGTLIALMLPYSITFLIAWTGLLVVWMWLGLPVGPGAELYLEKR